MFCSLCKEQLLDEQELCDLGHAACKAELEHRIDNGMCLPCGKNKAVNGKHFCSECITSHNFYPRGYVGP